MFDFVPECFMRRAGDVEPRDAGADPQPGCLLLQPHPPPGRHIGRSLLPGRRRRLVYFLTTNQVDPSYFYYFVLFV
jgi:hypothetical protein